MTKNDVIRKISNVDNIFTFITHIYTLLSIDSVRKIHREFNLAKSSGLYKEFKGIQELVEDIFLISSREFINWIEVWISELKNTKLKPLVFCYVTLTEMDDMFCEHSISKKIILDKGPLSNDKNYRLYLKPPTSYFNKILKQGNIIRGRQTVECDTNSLNSDFKSFEVIKETSLHDYEPTVTEYNCCFEKLNDLKIACIPMSKDIWFTVKKDCSCKEFTIEYNLLSKQNETIKKHLIECENQQVDIVIFPELTMSPSTKDEIKQFLTLSDFNHIKLCYLGSAWDNNRNEACLLTGKGTILILENKKIPYQQYSKADKCYYTEAIESDSKIHFLDVPQIGRMVYLICADFNDDNINVVSSVMHTNFVFVSAFTNNTNLMIETAKALAVRKGMAVILCNSCAALGDEKNHIAYCVTPKVRERQLFPNTIFGCSRCENKENCETCIKTFTICKT